MQHECNKTEIIDVIHQSVKKTEVNVDTLLAFYNQQKGIEKEKNKSSHSVSNLITWIIASFAVIIAFLK